MKQQAAVWKRHFGYGIGNGCFAAQSEQCGEKLMHLTTTQAEMHCKANLVKSEGKGAEDSKFEELFILLIGCHTASD